MKERAFVVNNQGTHGKKFMKLTKRKGRESYETGESFQLINEGRCRIFNLDSH